MRKISIILLSGGLDSALAFWRAREETDILYGLTFDYGQLASKREAAAAAAICQRYDVAHKIIKLDFFGALAGHPLFDGTVACPRLGAANLDDAELIARSAKAVWVPNRNGIFLNVAAGMAEGGLADSLYVGFNAEEAVTFPDNSEGFLKAANKALSFSTLRDITVISPTLKMDKKQIAAELVRVDFPLTLLWSCYRGDDKMCGLCESCLRLKRALGAAQVSSEGMFTAL